MRNILLQFVSGAFWLWYIIYFLFEKQAFNELLKVIGIQKQLKELKEIDDMYKILDILIIFIINLSIKISYYLNLYIIKGALPYLTT